MLRMYEGTKQANAMFPQPVDHCSRRFGNNTIPLRFRCHDPRNIGAQPPRFALYCGLNKTDQQTRTFIADDPVEPPLRAVLRLSNRLGDVAPHQPFGSRWFPTDEVIERRICSTLTISGAWSAESGSNKNRSVSTLLGCGPHHCLTLPQRVVQEPASRTPYRASGCINPLRRAACAIGRPTTGALGRPRLRPNRN
jgi:hypothetical protein